MSGQIQTPMHPNNMTDAELINSVYMGQPTAVERALASRLTLALEYIEDVTELLRQHKLLDEAPQRMH